MVIQEQEIWHEKLVLLVLVLMSTTAYLKGFPDKSDMSTPAMAKCSAAALKIEVDLWKKWYGDTKARYSIIYIDKGEKEIESYTLERIMDKKKELQGDGIDSKRAFQNYFDNNCAGEI